MLADIKNANEVFIFFVDYDRSVEEGIKAGHYHYANPQITEENFPPIEDEKGIKEKIFTLYNFKIPVENEYVIADMKKDGNRPTNLQEFLVFGEVKPELQISFPIVELGSVYRDNNLNHNVAYLDRFGPARFLCLDLLKSSRRSYYRFLAVNE